MKILVLRLSSLGDLIQTFPAISDLKKQYPTATIDWLVDERFAEVPTWHPGVDRVLPIPLRTLKKNIFRKEAWLKIKDFFTSFSHEKYDIICDVQGLIKSAIIAKKFSGLHCGFDWRSAREPLASIFYEKPFGVSKQVESPVRARRLFAEALGYALSSLPLDYGMVTPVKEKQKKITFLHGTTWSSKYWPIEFWCALAEQLSTLGYTIELFWQTEEERLRAGTIAACAKQAEINAHLSLSQIKDLLQQSALVISLDTGLGHLAAAQGTPILFLYGPSHPCVAGTPPYAKQLFLSPEYACSPCFQRTCYQLPTGETISPCVKKITPTMVYQQVKNILCLS